MVGIILVFKKGTKQNQPTNKKTQTKRASSPVPNISKVKMDPKEYKEIFRASHAALFDMSPRRCKSHGTDFEEETESSLRSFVRDERKRLLKMSKERLDSSLCFPSGNMNASYIFKTPNSPSCREANSSKFPIKARPCYSPSVKCTRSTAGKVLGSLLICLLLMDHCPLP